MLQQNDEGSADLIGSDAEGVGRTIRFPEVLVVTQTDYATASGREESDDGVGNTFVSLRLGTQRGEGVQTANQTAVVQRRDINPEEVTF